jgi:hypothetical protein
MRGVTLCSAAALAAVAIVAAAPAAATPNLIGAGDRLDYINPSGPGQFCTIGYAYTGPDRHTYAVTAGHCRNSTTGYARDTHTQTTGQFVRSVVEPRHNGGADYGLVDFGNKALPSAYIDGTPIGVGHPQPRIGQRVCHIGVSSGRHCGTISGAQGGDQYLTTGMPASIAGDSGGPVWAPTTNGYAQIIGIWLGEKDTSTGQHFGRFASLASGLTVLDASYSG